MFTRHRAFHSGKPLPWIDTGLTVNIMNKTTIKKALLLLALAGTGLSDAAAEDTPLPVAPSNLNAVVVSADEVSLSWYDNSTDERGFTVERSEDGMSWENIGSPPAGTGEFRDTALEPETRYLYRVFSYNTNGESSSSNEDTVLTPPLMDFQLDSGDIRVGAIFSQ